MKTLKTPYFIDSTYNPFTTTGRDHGPMLNYHTTNTYRGEIKVSESERILQKDQLEPEI